MGTFLYHREYKLLGLMFQSIWGTYTAKGNGVNDSPKQCRPTLNFRRWLKCFEHLLLHCGGRCTVLNASYNRILFKSGR
jgi:hypothetical protein